MGSKGRWAALAAVLLVGLIIGGALVYVYTRPSQQLAWVPTINPYIDDRAGLLDSWDAYDLQEFCIEVEANNSCEVALLIVNTTQPYGINDFALRTFEKNGIGQAGKDNGVLVVFSADEWAWRTVTGVGVSNILNGARLTEFEMDYLEPRLDPANISYGLTLYIYAIGLELVDNYHSPGNDPWNSQPIDFIPLNGWQLALVVIIFLVVLVVTRGRALGLIFLLFGRGGGGLGGFGGGKTGGGGSGGRR
ncbi:MAG: TPM domain-containing protein [Methanomassiliicoccales archaeon]